MKQREVEVSFKELTALVGIKEDEVEEWVIEAMTHEILDCKIDQVKQAVLVKATHVVG